MRGFDGEDNPISLMHASTLRWGTRFALVCTLIVAIWSAWRAHALGNYHVLDEAIAVGQVDLFLQGHLELYRLEDQPYPAGAMIPGYSALLSVPAWLSGRADVVSLRAYQLFVAGVFVFAAYYACSAVEPRYLAGLTTLQCFALPTVFPFLFLVYSDALSASLNLLVLGAVLRKQFNWAGILGLASLLVRQDNIAFLGFTWLLSYVRTYGTTVSLLAIRQHILRCWMLELCAAAFAIFVVWNGRIALDDPGAQTVQFNLESPFSALLWASFIFLPLHVASGRRALVWMREHPRLFLTLSAASIVVAMTFTIRHRWNLNEGMVRNWVLQLLILGDRSRLIAGLVVTVTIVSAWVNLERPHVQVPVLALWLARLSPVSLIEPRYMTAVFLAFMCLRSRHHVAVEVGLWLWLLGLGALLHFGVTGIMFQI